MQTLTIDNEAVVPKFYEWGAVKWVIDDAEAPGDVRTDDSTITLRSGQTLFIPVGARHELTNRGWEPAVYVCSFSAAGRGTLFADPNGPGVEPIRR